MIPLGSIRYYLEGVPEDFFWKELDKITAGQRMNPEFGYAMHFGKFENIFGGRRVGNEFSIFLYRPIARTLRTEIIAKGTVVQDGSGLMIKAVFVYPFRSFLMLIAIWLFNFVRNQFFHEYKLTFILVGTGIYCLLVAYNFWAIKRELSKQLTRIEEAGRLSNN